MVAHCHLCSTSNKSESLSLMITLQDDVHVGRSMSIAGARKNVYHTKYRDMIYADKFSCESLRKGIFIVGAIFVVTTMILNVYYYMYFTKATTQPAKKNNHATPTVGMMGHVWILLVEDLGSPAPAQAPTNTSGCQILIIEQP